VLAYIKRVNVAVSLESIKKTTLCVECVSEFCRMILRAAECGKAPHDARLRA